jgi:hypothetical protein
MAGAGFKTFNTGDVLTASDVNTYLMQQTVMVFDDAAARTSALGANVAEGMFSYLKDTNLTYRYDGSSWLSDAGTTSPLTTKGDVWGYSTTDARIPVGADGTILTADSNEALGVKWAAAAGGGKVLQIVQDSSTTQESTTSGTYVDTALSLTITPSSASSTILILVSINASAEASAADSGAIFRLVRGATQLAEFAVRHKDDNISRAIVTTIGPTYYDSPATTSATTYKIQFAQYVSGSTAFCAYGGFYSSITALEIGA